MYGNTAKSTLTCVHASHDMTVHGYGSKYQRVSYKCWTSALDRSIAAKIDRGPRTFSEAEYIKLKGACTKRSLLYGRGNIMGGAG